MRHVLFRATLIALSLFSAAASAATFKAGEHYTVIAEQPASEAVVQEFFSYGCGACSAFDPVFEQTKRMLSDQASFEYVPVDFGGGFWTPTQDLFLVLEALGRREELHTAAFAHFFGEPPHPRTGAGVKAFLARHAPNTVQWAARRNSCNSCAFFCRIHKHRTINGKQALFVHFDLSRPPCPHLKCRHPRKDQMCC